LPELLAQLPPKETPVAVDTDGSEVAQADPSAVTQLVVPAGEFTAMTIAELLQLELVQPEGSEETAAQNEIADPDLTDLSLLELMNLRVRAATPSDLPDLSPPDAKLQLNGTDLDRSPPSHLSPESGLTPIGVLPGTSWQPATPPPPPPPSPASNVAPVANDDIYTVLEDGLLVKAQANGVLLNDRDANADPLSVTLVSGPTNGTLSLSANAAFIYDPNPNFTP